MPDIETSVNTSEAAGQTENTTTTQQQENTTTTEQTTPSTESVNGEVTTSQQKEAKPVQTPEENAKFAQIRRDYEAKIQQETQTARQQARDEFIASQGYTWNGKPITTEAEYNQALQEKKYQEAGIDPNLINEAVNNNPVLKQAQKIIQNNQKQEQERQNMIAFLDYFKESNGREFDGSKDSIPPEVWQEVNSGKSLMDAYTKYENKQLRQKLADYEKGATTQKVNQTNAQTSTGSFSGQGNVPNGFISKEEFLQNKDNQKWLTAHYEDLLKSQTIWNKR